jgi:hypothetical protein
MNILPPRFSSSDISRRVVLVIVDGNLPRSQFVEKVALGKAGNCRGLPKRHATVQVHPQGKVQTKVFRRELPLDLLWQKDWHRLVSRFGYRTSPRDAKYPVNSCSIEVSLRASKYIMPRREQNSRAESTKAANVCL